MSDEPDWQTVRSLATVVIDVLGERLVTEKLYALAFAAGALIMTGPDEGARQAARAYFDTAMTSPDSRG